jgi:hypothetical protein
VPLTTTVCTSSSSLYSLAWSLAYTCVTQKETSFIHRLSHSHLAACRTGWLVGVRISLVIWPVPTHGQCQPKPPHGNLRMVFCLLQVRRTKSSMPVPEQRFSLAFSQTSSQMTIYSADPAAQSRQLLSQPSLSPRFQIASLEPRPSHAIRLH